MVKLRALSNMINSLTGTRTRRSRALRDVWEWAESLQKFLTEYGLYGSSDFSLLLDNLGKAKFDLTAITYKGRLLIRAGRNIKDRQVSSKVSEMVAMAEDLRRVLVDPYLRGEKLGETILNLRKSYEELQDALSDME